MVAFLRDIGAGRSELQVRKGKGRQDWHEFDLARSSRAIERYAVEHDAINSATAEVHREHLFASGQWKPRIETKMYLTRDRDHFYWHVDIDAYLDRRRVFCRTRKYGLPRQGV